jgi:hypothetical protein
MVPAPGSAAECMHARMLTSSSCCLDRPDSGRASWVAQPGPAPLRLAGGALRSVEGGLSDRGIDAVRD